MSANQKLKDLAVSDSGFVFDPSTGTTFNVNVPGSRILDLLKNETSFQDILVAIEGEFEVGNADLHRHVQEFLASLVSFGLITKEESDLISAENTDQVDEESP
ncbi:MAG: PqqD family protein [bacterium]|nr:PqqD family protein [bacterium]